jgi:hypothetical protein
MHQAAGKTMMNLLLTRPDNGPLMIRNRIECKMEFSYG